MKRLGSRVGNAIMMRMSHAKHERTRDGSKYDDNDTNEGWRGVVRGGRVFAGLKARRAQSDGVASRRHI